MDRVVVAVLGAGNVACSPQVLATLASYFGERPLEIILYDADEERLDLFDRVAHTFVAFTRSTSLLSSTIEPGEALAAAERVIVQLDEHGARMALKRKLQEHGSKGAAAHSEDADSPDQIADALPSALFRLPSAHYQAALSHVLANVSPNAEVLSLLPEDVELPIPIYRRLSWPGKLHELERGAIPHQALRWIHGEEYPFEFFAEHEDSPLKLWLDDPKTATVVKG